MARNEKFTGYPSSGIKVHICHDHHAAEEDQYVLFDKEDFSGGFITAEDVCIKVAKKLNIGPIGLPMFALRLKSRNGWFAPTYKIEYRSDKLSELQFSLRFLPPVGEKAEGLLRLTSMKYENVLNYLYLQCREDFLENRIEAMKQERQLGFCVVDMVRFIKENNVSPPAVKKLDPSHFLPSSVTKNLGLLKKWRLTTNMKNSVQQELADTTNDEVQSMKLRFIVGIKKENAHFSREEFLATEGAVSITAIVDPYCSRFPGLSFLRHGRDESFAAIEELYGINIQRDERSVRVMVSRKTGKPVVLNMSNSSDCDSFAALLSGYHRMMVDYHTACTLLCDEVSSSMQRNLYKLKCHGPVSTGRFQLIVYREDWARNRLKDRHKGNKMINYLLKQKSDAYDHYCLFYIAVSEEIPLTNSDPPIKVYNFVKIKNGNFQLQLGKNKTNPEFSSLSSFKDKCNLELEGDIELHSITRPELPDDKHLLVCRPLETPKEAIQIQQPVRQLRAQTTLVSNVEIVKEYIGVGIFTEVHQGIWNQDSHLSAEKELVAVKQARVSNESTLYFLRAIHQTTFWCHSSIMRVKAICLEPPVRALLEYCPLGQLDNFLIQDKFKANAVQLSHLLYAAEQIAQALDYLHNKPSSHDGRGEVHGNLKCGNIMVCSFSPKLLSVKLADPGFIHMYNALSMEHECNKIRLAWIAPELYPDLKQMTLATDIYAFGITLHELFSYGERPYRFKEEGELFESLSRRRLVELNKPRACPDLIMKLINNCKKLKSDERPSTRDILGVICTTMQETDTCGELTINDYSRIAPVIAPDYKEGTQMAVGLPQSVPQGGSSDPLLTPAASCCDMSSNSRIGSTMTESTMDDYPASLYAATPFLNSRPLPVVPTVQIPEEIFRNLLTEVPRGLLGEGNYGKVVQMEWTRLVNGMQTKQLVAVKMLKNVGQSGYEAMAELEREFHIMCQLDHDNVVRILGQSPKLCSGEPMLLVMEYVSKGSLNHHLHKYNSGPNCIKQNTLLRYCREIAQGMQYLHDKNIVHRDLATRNVLVTKDENMKISDFGLSRMLGEKDYYRIMKGKGIPALWYAPEALDQKLFTTSSDVWSFGVTTWEIYSYGVPPRLCELNQMIPRLSSGERLKQPKSCSAGVYALMKKCWEYDHKKRTSMALVLQNIHDLEASEDVSATQTAQSEAS